VNPLPMTSGCRRGTFTRASRTSAEIVTGVTCGGCEGRTVGVVESRCGTNRGGQILFESVHAPGSPPAGDFGRASERNLRRRRFDAEYLEEMKGIADGAASAGARFDDRRIDLVDIVTLNSEIEISFLEHGLEATATGLDRTKFEPPQYSQPKALPKEHCSAFAATGQATLDGRIVVDHITMSDLDYVRHYNVW